MPVPDGLFVRHTCDNPPCCNPAHLLIGTAADNTHDAIERDRLARGFDLSHTKLSREQVEEVRSKYRTFSIPGVRGRHSNRHELAAEYGVGAKYIADVAAGRERADV